jgi:uncharacterized Tic20 family protein
VTAAEDLTQMMHNPAPGRPVAEGMPVRDPADASWAMLGYLGAVFIGVGTVIPLLVFALRRRKSPFMRYHAARSLNISVTVLLYLICIAILGGLLALDTVTVALSVALPLLFVLWVLMLKYLVRGVVAAQRGETFDVPGWICATIVQPGPVGTAGPAS